LIINLQGELDMSGRYEKEYEESIHDPEKFWGKLAQGIQWYKPCVKVNHHCEL